MNRLTRWMFCLSCLLVTGSIGMFMLMRHAEAPSVYRQLQKDMTQEEVAAILGGKAFPVLRLERQDSKVTGLLYGTEWIDLGGPDNAVLFKKHLAKLTEGQLCQLWDHNDAGIIVIFSDDGRLLEKEYRNKRQKSFLQRFLDLVW